MSNTWNTTKKYIYADVYRNIGDCSKKIVLKEFLSKNSTVALLICLRLCQYCIEKEKKYPWLFGLHVIAYRQFKRRQVFCGIEINQRTKIGYGLRLPHRGAIVIHPMAQIGNNCEIMQGVTIGNNILKDRDAVPIIGNEVLLCAGAKVIGKIKIGNTVVVGANSVVNKDIADNCIVGGMPARILKSCGNEFVINLLEVN